MIKSMGLNLWYLWQPTFSPVLLTCLHTIFHHFSKLYSVALDCVPPSISPLSHATSEDRLSVLGSYTYISSYCRYCFSSSPVRSHASTSQDLPPPARCLSELVKADMPAHGLWIVRGVILPASPRSAESRCMVSALSSHAWTYFFKVL